MGRAVADPGEQVRLVRAITRLHLQPCAVRIAIVATAVPPVIAAVPALGLGGYDGTGRGADSRARDGAAAASDRTAKDTAKRPADDRPAEHILRGRLLNRQHARQ